MNVKIYITLVILLAINFIICIKSLRSVVGPDHRKFFHSCSTPNPYIYTTAIIFFRNALVIFNTKNNLFRHLYQLGLSTTFSAITYTRRNPTNCNATSNMYDLIAASVFLILSFSNPFAEFLNHLQKLVEAQQNLHIKTACSCSTRRRLRKKPTISVLKPPSNFETDSPSLTNSDILIAAEDRFCNKVDQETQTVVCFESKCCQHPNKDSMHFLRGNIPVQLIERTNGEGKFKVQSEMVCVKNKFLDCKNGIGDGKGQFKNGCGFENNSILTCADSGDSDIKNSQMQRHIIMNTLKSHINRNLSILPTKCPSPIQTRNNDNGIVKIEDLISESGDMNLSMVPTKDVIVPTEVPKAVAAALKSMVVNSHISNVKSLLQANVNSGKFKKWHRDASEPERECLIATDNVVEY